MILNKIKPLGRKVVVKLLPLYKGHQLVIASAARHYEQVRMAEVLGVGNRVQEVRVGDEVMFEGHVGKWIDDPAKIGYQTEPLYRAVDEDDILAVKEKEHEQVTASV